MPNPRCMYGCFRGAMVSGRMQNVCAQVLGGSSGVARGGLRAAFSKPRGDMGEPADGPRCAAMFWGKVPDLPKGVAAQCMTSG